MEITTETSEIQRIIRDYFENGQPKRKGQFPKLSFGRETSSKIKSWRNTKSELDELLARRLKQ